MHVIAVLNQKGGTGKTTIATNLAIALQLTGKDVILIDSDPQASAFKWWQLKKDHPLDVIPIDKPAIEKSLGKLKRLDYVVIDGAPSNDEMADDAIMSADLVLIPVTPSVHDIMASDIVVKKVKQRSKFTGGKLKSAFVINMAIKGTKIEKETEESLMQYGLPILSTHIYRRVVYATTAKDGGCVFDDSETIAASEINNIMNECIDLLMIK